MKHENHEQTQTQPKSCPRCGYDVAEFLKCWQCGAPQPE